LAAALIIIVFLREKGSRSSLIQAKHTRCLINSVHKHMLLC